MTAVERVDAFIEDYRPNTGNEFSKSDYMKRTPGAQSWDMEAHKKSPNKRYVTQCVGMGPKAIYRVVKTPSHVLTSSVTDMHKREIEEAVNRYVNEFGSRIAPTAISTKRGRALIDKSTPRIVEAFETLGLTLSYAERQLRLVA